MQFTIRKAKLTDLKAIQELNLKLFKKEAKEYDPTLSLEWTFGRSGTEYFKERITEEDGCVLVAEVKGKIVGYLAGGITETDSYRKVGRLAEIENMFVEEEYRNQGIGGKLIQKFLDWAKRQKVERVKVVAFALNYKALRFYRKHGFKEYEVVLEKEVAQDV